MRIKESFIKLFLGLKKSIERFPLSIISSTACAVVLIILTQRREMLLNDDTLSRVAMVLALGIPVFLCIKLTYEKWDIKGKVSILLGYILGIAFLIFYFFILLQNMKFTAVTRYVGVTLIFYLAFMTIPYIKKREGFELYIIKLFGQFFITFLYSLILYLGLAAIIFTLDKLLGIHFGSKIYAYILYIVSGIFAPCYFLSGVPFIDTHFSEENYPKIFKILILYIVIPLMSVYTLILYIYFAKIIITTNWPKGLVSHLVLWYSVIAAVVLFLISPLLDRISWLKKYMKVFPKLLLPLIILMFFSIGLRVRQYGITENRYFPIALGYFTFIIMVYFSFTKKLRNIVLPIALAIITFISVFGPISSYSLSIYSQNKRFDKILTKNSMIKNNNIIPNKKISEKGKAEITNLLNYFEIYHSYKDIKKLPDNFKFDDMEKIFGFKESYAEQYNSSYFNFYSDNDMIFDIRGYDYLLYPQPEESGGVAKGKQLYTLYNYDTGIFKLESNNKEIYSKNLKKVALEIAKKQLSLAKGDKVNAEELSYIDENNKVKVKIQFRSISGEKDYNNDYVVNGLDFYVFIKIK